jgi:hypothetical protein
MAAPARAGLGGVRLLPVEIYTPERHFGHLYGKRVEGLMVLRPAHYFERRAAVT